MSEWSERDTEHKPKMICAFGDRSFGGQFRMGNRVYSSNHIAVALLAQSVGGLGGATNLYLVEEDNIVDE